MKKLLLTLVVIAVSTGTVNGQYGRLKGSTTFQMGVGFTDSGILGNVFYGRKFDKSIRGIVGLSFTTGRIADVTYYGSSLDALVSYEMMSNRNNSYSLNIQGGITFVVDAISQFESSDLNSPRSFNTGAVGGFEAEYYVTRSFAFVMAPNIRYYVKEDFGRVRYHVSVGMRFLIK